MNPQIIEPNPALPDYHLSALPEPLQRAVGEMNWPSLMPVQSKAIPYILNANDLIVQSKTGSGKTAAFLLPILQVIETSVAVPQTLILVPTRELAKQVEDECGKLGKYLPVKSLALYGGTKLKPQLDSLETGVHLVVGTPGRVMDHLERGTLNLSNLRDLVLDEADEMLSMGFYDDMKRILKYIPAKRCTYMFSATMSTNVQRLAQEFLTTPKFINMCPGEFSVSLMEQEYYLVDAMDKDKFLFQLLQTHQPDASFVFCNTKKTVLYLYEFLKSRGINVGMISGDVAQNVRESTIQKLKNRSLNILVVTDLAARGLDIQGLSHVYNYDIPDDQEIFVHRCGRTARAGNSGKAITLVTDYEEIALKKIAQAYQLQLNKKVFGAETPHTSAAILPSVDTPSFPTASEATELTEIQVEPEVVSTQSALAEVSQNLENLFNTTTNWDQEKSTRYIPAIEALFAQPSGPKLLANLYNQFFK